MFSVCSEEHLTDYGIVVVHILEEPLLGDGLCEGLDVSLREEVVLGLITCVGEGLVSRPHLLGDSAHKGSFYLTSVKLKGSKDCLRMMKKKRKKMKVIKRSRKSEETLTSCMDEMRQTLGHLEPLSLEP